MNCVDVTPNLLVAEIDRRVAFYLSIFARRTP